MGARSIEKFQKIAFSKIKQNAAIQTLLDFSYNNNLAAAAWRLPAVVTSAVQSLPFESR